MPKLTVLITGSEGLIGSRIAKALSREFQVVGFDLKPRPASRRSQ